MSRRRSMQKPATLAAALLAATTVSAHALDDGEIAASTEGALKANVANALQVGPIAPQSLAAALDEFATRTKLQVVYRSEVAATLSTKGSAANLSPEQTLEALLHGTGLRYQFINERTVAIRPAAEEGAPALQSTSAAQHSLQKTNLRLAQSDGAARGRAESSSTEVDSSEDSNALASTGAEKIEIEQLIVTGSHIRGAQNLSSPMITFDRQDIEAGGYATTQQLIQSLPQNLNSLSDRTFDQVNGGMGVTESYAGSGLNLRGLGGDATLVLVNGRRLVASGNGSFADISLIPLSAIERVEILTEGASAIYGADAVGGVVNIIMRRDFSGAESRVRYGSVTDGDHEEWQAGQLFGHAWGSGQAMISYEYYDRTQLRSDDRDSFVAQPGIYEDAVLIPAQKRHGAFAMLSQRLGERVEASADLFYGRRETLSGFTSGAVPYSVLTAGEQYGAAAALSVNVAADWNVRMSGSFDRSESDMEQWLQSSTLMFSEGNNSELSSLELAAEGSLFRLAGGDVRLAIGAQHREQSLDGTTAAYAVPVDRSIDAVYAEMLIPIVGSHNRRRGVESLSFNLASRYEEYSDFGSSFNPKLGVAWEPLRGLNVRGTWGTSFKAPLLVQMNPNREYVYVTEGQYLTEQGPATVILRSGSGEGLRPEESTNWTFGFDVSPIGKHWTVSATYFDIDYDKRIRTPFPGGYDTPRVLLDPTYAVVYDRNPQRAHVEQLMAHPNALCLTAQFGMCESMPDASEVAAIIDGRYRNLAGVRQSGIDMSASYEIASALGDWMLQVGGTHLLESREQLIPGGAQLDASNDVWRPADTRLRGALSFARGAFKAAGFINYIDSYPDRRRGIDSSLQRSHVASWTTIDATLLLELGKVGGWLKNSVLMFSANNVFDRAPLYVGNDYGFVYDGVNADPRGRFLSLQVTASW